MQQPESLDGRRSVRSTRLLGWFLAANAVAMMIALIGAAPGAAGAARQVALWCGIG